MSNLDRTTLFDKWATTYDRSVIATGDFPFAGYEHVLDEMVRRADVRAGSRILDLGTGTGNAAARFAALRCTVWGVDFSAEMLAHARAKLPQATLVQADILGRWPDELNHQFDQVVSAYVLHEFDLSTKVDLIQRLIHQHLAAEGRIVIGDIAFETAQDREQAHQQWRSLWDEDEYYWAADEARAAFEHVGFRTEYVQVSWCGGVFVITPPNNR